MVESNDTIAAPTLDVKEPTGHYMSNNIADNVMTNTMLSVQGSMNTNELLSSQNEGFFSSSIISYYLSGP